MGPPPDHHLRDRPRWLHAYHREMVYRHVAFVHALRLHLRGQRDCDENLREQLGEHDLPEPLSIVDGVAY